MKQVTLPPAPFAAARGLSPRLESIIIKAMAKSPDERFASFEVMATALEDQVGVGRRSLFPAHLIVLLAVVCGAGALVWLWCQELPESQRADSLRSPASIELTMRELQTLLTRTRDNEDRAFIEKKTAVSALFFETCAQHHETVITQGPSLLKRVSGGDDEDVWDRQNCAEALARSYQAVGRYEDANRLRDLRRGI